MSNPWPSVYQKPGRLQFRRPPDKQRGGPWRSAPGLPDFPRLQAVIHIELDRMRRHAKSRDFFHLERDVSIEHVVRENPASSQKFVILLEIVERFVERRTRMRNLGGDFRRQVVQVLEIGLARVAL